MCFVTQALSGHLTQGAALQTVGLFVYNPGMDLFQFLTTISLTKLAGFTTIHCLQLALFRPLHPVSLEMPTLATALLLFLACVISFHEDDHLPSSLPFLAMTQTM